MKLALLTYEIDNLFLFQIFDFELSENDMKIIASLNKNFRIGYWLVIVKRFAFKVALVLFCHSAWRSIQLSDALLRNKLIFLKEPASF